MDAVALEAQKRNKSVLAKKLLWENILPAEVYGAGLENVSVQMDYQAFRKAYIVAGENTVIDLSIDGESPRKVLVHEVNFDPVSGNLRHVDFVNVNMNKAVHTHIPLEFVGVSPAVKDLAGVMMHNVTELEVKCLPGDLVHSIEVDVSGLVDFHSSLHVKNLTIPSGLTVLTDPELTVATVSAPKVEVEPEPVEATPSDATAEGVDASADEAKKETSE